MEKLYVNEIRPDGEISTVGLFYSLPEAQKIVDLLRANPIGPAIAMKLSKRCAMCCR